MDKIWFILIDGSQEGPYSYKELARDKRLALDTYVWREGLENWVRAEELPELLGIFYKEVPEKEEDEEEDEEGEDSSSFYDGRMTLEMEHSQPPYYLLWLLIAILLFFTAFFIQYL